MGILMSQICCKSPVPSASLSVLEPLLSEEDPVFLDTAIDSTGFSTVKKITICSCHSRTPYQFLNFIHFKINYRTPHSELAVPLADLL